MNVCGIDVSSKKLDIVVSKNKKALKAKIFSNDAKGHAAIIKLLKKHKVSHVAMEATGYYHLDIAIALQSEANLKVMVVNPRSIHNFTKALMVNTKTDAIDAKIIAQFIERMDFIPWVAPSRDIFELRSCARYMSDLTKQQTAMKNQYHAYSATKNMSILVLDDLKARIKQAGKSIGEVEKHMLVLIESNQRLTRQYDLLIGMKGVGIKTIVKVLGEVSVLSADMKGKQWVAHAGLYPRVYQSGSSLNKSVGIGKSGNSYIREALYMSALCASRHDPYIKAYYQHLINDNGLKKIQAICAVMRKMLLAMHGMLRDNKPFDNRLFYGAELS
jgi:transposase